MKELNTKLQEARKRRKRRKKEPLGWFVNLDGGDVEAGINTFNNAMNTGFGEDLEQDTTDLIKDIDIEVSEDSYKDFHIIKDDEKWFVKELTEYEELLNYATDVDWELADNTDEQREIYYGQKDHVRLYGKDFKQRFESYGLQINIYSPKDYMELRDIKKYGLIENDIVLICSKKE